MQQKVLLDFGKKKISVEAQVVGKIGRTVGLMFSRREKAKILLFKFKKPTRLAIHSFFVFFPFIAIWIGSDGKIMEIREVKSFIPYIVPKKNFISLVEIPLNRKYKKVTDDIERFK
ncbi:MAG: hypothetical protein WAU65_03345 [Candidatus Nanoarchaeia archaeon]